MNLDWLLLPASIATFLLAQRLQLRLRHPLANALLWSLLLTWQGVPSTLQGGPVATPIDASAQMAEQKIPLGPVAAMVAACAPLDRHVPVTVKCRLGVDDDHDYDRFRAFIDRIADAGCGMFIVHARNAWLQGLSPKENREVPPLRYDVAAQLKQDFPELEIILNGGIKTLEDCQQHLQTFVGVMLGREAYHNPYLLAQVDQQLFGATRPVLSRLEAMQSMRGYIAAHLAEGGSMHHITRHMLGLGQGFNGARRFRQLLSVDIHKTNEPLALFDQAAQLLQGR